MRDEFGLMIVVLLLAIFCVDAMHSIRAHDDMQDLIQTITEASHDRD